MPNPGSNRPSGRIMVAEDVQPRQPRDLRGALRFAMEAQGEHEPIFVGQMDENRQAFLAEALRSLVVDVREVLAETLPILQDQARIGALDGEQEITEEVKDAFHNLCDYIENLDASDHFCKAGGFDAFELLYNTKNPELWLCTNDLLAGLCQNFTPAQELALERGLLKTLLDRLQDPDTKFKSKFVYALSSCVREFGPGCRELISLGGCSVLAPLLRADVPGTEVQPLRAKTARLLAYLAKFHDDAREKLITLNLPEILAPVIDKNIGICTEHLLSLLLVFINKHDPKIIEQCRTTAPCLRKAINNILIDPNVTDDRDQNRETIEYASAILSIAFGEGRPLCEEEADR